MAANIKERRRKVNPSTMNGDQQEQVGLELGKKIGQMCDKAAKQLTEEVNKLTGIYGLEAQIQVVFKDSEGNLLTPD